MELRNGFSELQVKVTDFRNSSGYAATIAPYSVAASHDDLFRALRLDSICSASLQDFYNYLRHRRHINQLYLSEELAGKWITVCAKVKFQQE